MEAWLGVHKTFVSGLFVVVVASTGTYFYENIPVNGLGYVRWVDLKLSVGLLNYPLGYRICPLGSFNAPFFLPAEPEKKFLLILSLA